MRSITASNICTEKKKEIKTNKNTQSIGKFNKQIKRNIIQEKYLLGNRDVKNES